MGVLRPPAASGGHPVGAPLFRPALFSLLSRGYSRTFLAKDVAAGLTVGIVALPLAMAFAIASGMPPERGLFTAVVAGGLISLLGGSRYQIGGPTGAFVVIVAGIAARHGYQGLVVATLMAGALLVLMGVFRLGKVLQFIPYPVTTGFTAGIGLYIFSTQLKDLLGLQVGPQPAEFLGKLASCWEGIGTAQPGAALCAGATLLAMYLVRRFCPRIPAHIVGIVSSMLVVWLLGLQVETIGSRFGGIPATLPSFAPPEDFFGLAAEMVPDALAIAILAGIESLLSAVVADGMTGERHNSSTELMAQGLANIASGLFGGIPATGAIARTATNIRAGAATPVAGIIHAATLALCMLCLAPLASLIPLASLAGVLCYVAWDMSEVHKVARLLRAPKSDVFVLLVTFLLTVLVDLTVAVQVGVVLAALLFMRRMSEVGNLRFSAAGKRAQAEDDLEPDSSSVLVYEIDGPFFFGMAERFLSVLHAMREHPKVIVLRMDNVPTIDATAIHALETFMAHAGRMGARVVVSGLQERVGMVLDKTGVLRHLGEGNVLPTLALALSRAEDLAGEQGAA
ncbi:MAG: SulP family inorganic anion transporter [Desulfovibrionaceae bacterium]